MQLSDERICELIHLCGDRESDIFIIDGEEYQFEYGTEHWRQCRAIELVERDGEREFYSRLSELDRLERQSRENSYNKYYAEMGQQEIESYATDDVTDTDMVEQLIFFASKFNNNTTVSSVWDDIDGDYNCCSEIDSRAEAVQGSTTKCDYFSTIENGHTLLLKNEILPTTELYQGVESNYQQTLVQSEIGKEGPQGKMEQNSEQVNNTIITNDAGVSEACPNYDATLTLKYLSSEPTYEFSGLTDRWMPLTAIRVSITHKLDTLLKSFSLPYSLYEEIQNSPNLVPFSSFTFSQLDITMKFIVNASKFHCGKVVVASKYDSYEAEWTRSSVVSALQRNHVMLDLSANNQATLEIPFIYRRGFVRNVHALDQSNGVRAGKFASVDLFVLSPLSAPSGAATDVYIRPYVKFKRATFAGMGSQVVVQSALDDMLKKALPLKSIKAVLVGAEAMIDQLGESQNQDKPTNDQNTNVTARPRPNFCNSKSLYDGVVMRMNPLTTTSYRDIQVLPNTPQTVLDIAKIWGLYSTFKWTATDKPGEVLTKWMVDPTIRTDVLTYSGVPTPLEYVSSMYNFWSGPLEVRLDFVSNDFHTGTVMLSVEYERSSDEDPEVNSASAYTKTFHLGDQKSVSFVIPYIHDTVWRRTSGQVFDPVVASDDMLDPFRALSLRAETRTVFRIRVINDLRPASSTTQTVDVLMFLRGGENFMVHGLKQSSMLIQPELGYMTGLRDFPRYAPVSDVSFNTQQLPDVQMEMDINEVGDDTHVFSDGVFSLAAQTLDTQVSIKDILRRPTLLINSEHIATQGVYYLPLMPPSYLWQALTPGLLQTPQVMLMSLFRYWRGSMRYTIIYVPDSKMEAPVYITHLPHSGVVRIGMHETNGYGPTHQPVFSGGSSTTILIPSLNPTESIEIPYDTENQWTLTFEDDSSHIYSFRDKGDTNSGHLAITPIAPGTLTIWWSAGDDFEFTNFYGIPKVVSKAADRGFSDDSNGTKDTSALMYTPGLRDKAKISREYATFENNFKNLSVRDKLVPEKPGTKDYGNPVYEEVAGTRVWNNPGVSKTYMFITTSLTLNEKVKKAYGFDYRGNIFYCRADGSWTNVQPSDF